jgi:prevent-host-death family protein
MLIVNARKARVVFSELLSEAEHGAVVSITRRGREVADMHERI